MKKVLLSLGVAAFLAVGLSSCSKCGSCTDSNGDVGIEYCKGNVFEDAIYNSEKTWCEEDGGTWN